MFYCKESGPIPSHPVQLDEGFISWMEKLSNNLDEQAEKAVIVIDGVDLVTVGLTVNGVKGLVDCVSV